MRAPAMRTQQKLHEPMRDQFVKRQEFLVRFKERPGIGSGGYSGSRFQRCSCLANDRIFERFTRDLPHRNESIDCLGKAYGEDAMIARCAERFEIQIERTTEAIRTKEHEHIQ